MQYTKISFTITPISQTAQEILIAELSELDFDSFEDTELGINAYIPTKDYNIEDITNLYLLNNKAFDISFEEEVLSDSNWNKTWEDNYFEPIEIGNRCIVKSPSHTNTKDAEYNILIKPKLSFGTGHHETTGLILKYILDMDFNNKTVLDMGCGTAILGILAAMRNANYVHGIDIEEWAYNNAKENISLNNISNMEVFLGDASLIKDNKYDVIFANINRNILLNNISKYKAALNDGGILLLSGFYESDIETIDKECNNNNLKQKAVKENNNWVAVMYQ